MYIQFFSPSFLQNKNLKIQQFFCISTADYFFSNNNIFFFYYLQCDFDILQFLNICQNIHGLDCLIGRYVGLQYKHPSATADVYLLPSNY